MKTMKLVLKHSLNYLYTNVQSLVNKIDELEGILQMERVDLIFITETWETDASDLRLEGYTLHSRVRADRRGGGLDYISGMTNSLMLW